MSNPAVPAIRPSMAIFDEIRWVVQIRKSLEEEHELEEEIPVCIFNVPKTLMAYNPELYIPQMVSIGPYHHWRQEINEMERYKLAAAKRTQKRYHDRKFNSLVVELTKLEPRIRGCYHKFLDCNSETLAWMMAVDLSFLLEVLQAQASTVKEGKSLNRVMSSSHLIDCSGRKSAYNAILRDIVMLENQVPLFVLRKMLEFEHSSLELADEVLSSMLFAVCRELSPFNMEDVPSIQITEISHLLDFLYQTIVPKSEVVLEIVEEEDGEGKPLERESSLAKSGYVKRLFDEIWKLLGKLNRGPVHYLKRVLLSKPLKLVVKLPWTILTKLPGVSMFVKPLESIFFPENKEDEKPEDSEKANRPPLVEEIMIPSVTELYNAGVRFMPSHGDVKSISFDTKTCTFFLPAVSLDVNTEVVLRNLVAYETTTAQGALIFTRYTELMNGIIDREEDAKLLREKGIVFNYLKSDAEVADMWNGMSKSVRLTRVPWMDKAIEDVNKYHSGRWKVKLRNFVTVYVFGSWKFLTFLAAVFLLLLMTLQAFCSVYSCARILRISTSVIPTNE
ncbi:hypothetical protein ACHQM5_028904 [Ranunculus cassubicifolius]